MQSFISCSLANEIERYDRISTSHVFTESFSLLSMFSSCPSSPRQAIRAGAALLIFAYISSAYGFKPNCILETEKVPQQKAKKPYTLFSRSFMVVNPFSYFRIAVLQHGNSLPYNFLSGYSSLPFLYLCSLISVLILTSSSPFLFH